ncbi:MAG: type II secretion system F family protein [Methylocystis sp.]|nr:type II secretion system F family protein [Methylocystis sp.]
MDAISLPYVVFFVSSVLIIFSTINYFAKERVAKQAVNRRLALLEKNESAVATLELLRRERGFFGDSRWGPLQTLQDWLTQSGLRMSRSAAFAAFLGFSSLVTVGVTRALDHHWIALPIGLVVSAVAAIAFIRFIRARRIAKFSRQLPEVLEIIVRSLRSGHPLPASLSLVARETRDPAGTEFGMAFDEVAYGLDVPTAIKNMSRRVGDPDLLYVLTSISIQSASGGNLSEILARLSTTIRERQKLRLRIGAMTAEGRLSGLVLTVLPILVFLVVSWLDPSYFGDVWDRPAFVNTMRVAIGLLIVGLIMIKRLVNFRY